MAISLRTYASGDTDYIAKMNENVSLITSAINALQSQAAVSGGEGTAAMAAKMMDALFSHADALIGPSSYVITQHPTSITVAPGSMYLGGDKVVATYTEPVNLVFTGQTAGTYYIVVDISGVPMIQPNLIAGTTYSVNWTGSGFLGEPNRIAACMFDAAEATESRSADTPSGPQEFPTLDDRLETTGSGGGEDSTGGVKKVGVSLDGGGVVLTTGVKGMVQLDYGGIILGWSIVADQVGSISVDVNRKASLSPPDAPAIPNTTTDKISASSPIAITSAQSAAGGGFEIITWNTVISQWDVIQFNVTAVTAIKRATLYIRIAT